MTVNTNGSRVPLRSDENLLELDSRLYNHLNVLKPQDCILSVGSVNYVTVSELYYMLIYVGTSLVVWRLGLHLPMHGVWVQSLVGEIRSHMPWGQKFRT